MQFNSPAKHSSILRTTLSILVAACLLGLPTHADPTPSRLMVPTEPLPVYPGIVVRGLDMSDLPKSGVSNADILERLPNHRIHVTTEQIDKTGKVSYLVAAAAQKNTTVRVTHDWGHYTTVVGGPETLRIGIGVRIEAYFFVKSRSVNTGTLFNLGIAAEQNQVAGSLSVVVIGISGEQVAPLIPAPAPLSIDNINVALQALALIKAKEYDPSTVITPQIIAREVTVSETTTRGVVAPQ